MRIVKAVCIAVCISMASGTAHAEQVQLSKRTVEQFKLLQGQVTDANQSLILANILIAFTPFVPLLSPPDAVTSVEIALTEWAPLAEASSQLSTFYRGELKKFCQLEAVSQHNSAKDYKFWLDLADSFDGKKTYFVGVWENIQGPDVIKASFSESNSLLKANVTGNFSGNQVIFPVTQIAVVTPRNITFVMSPGGENYSCLATISDSKRAFSMSCKDPRGTVEVTSFVKAN